jgi:hypothetical protein
MLARGHRMIASSVGSHSLTNRQRLVETYVLSPGYKHARQDEDMEQHLMTSTFLTLSLSAMREEKGKRVEA